MNDIDNPEVAEMVLFLDPETTEILQFLDPESTKIFPFLDQIIMKMDKNISGSRKYRNGVTSGFRNRKNGPKHF